MSHLLSSTSFDEICFGDDFDSVGLVRIHRRTHVDFGKAALSQKPSTEITMQCVSLSIDLSPLLLDHDILTVRGFGRRHRVRSLGNLRRRHCRGTGTLLGPLTQLGGGTVSSNLMVTVAVDVVAEC
jgi:hypothetical protein